MSTRAQIAIQIGPEEWAHVYVHFDGYPAHMLPALARWKPEDILAAREIRQVRADEIEAFEKPREPPALPCPPMHGGQAICSPWQAKPRSPEQSRAAFPPPVVARQSRLASLAWFWHSCGCSWVVS